MANLSGVTKHFPEINERFTTTLSGTAASGADTLGLNSVSGLTDGSVFVGIVDPGVENKEQAFTGTVDLGNSQIIDVEYTTGANTEHTAGSTVVDWVTSTTIGIISKGARVSLNQDGTLKNGAVSSSSMIGNGIITLEKLDADARGGIKPTTTTSTATLTPDVDDYNMFVVTSQDAAISIATPTGSVSQGKSIIIRLKDNGTGRAITWASIYRAVGVTLPTTTVANKTFYFGCVYNVNDTKWDVIAVSRED